MVGKAAPGPDPPVRGYSSIQRWVLLVTSLTEHGGLAASGGAQLSTSLPPPDGIFYVKHMYFGEGSIIYFFV